MPVYQPPSASSGGSVATDTIWDAAGDLAVGTGADAAARVALGASATVLTSNGSTATWSAPAVTIIPRLTASAARNSGNTGSTLTDDDTLLWAVGTNQVWFFESILLLNAANATMDFKQGWNTVPAGTAIRWGYGYIAGASFPGSPAVAPATTPQTLLSESTTAISGTAVGRSLFFTSGFVITAGTAGTITLQWAQNTSDAGNLILDAGSHLRLTRCV